MHANVQLQDETAKVCSCGLLAALVISMWSKCQVGMQSDFCDGISQIWSQKVGLKNRNRRRCFVASRSIFSIFYALSMPQREHKNVLHSAKKLFWGKFCRCRDTYFRRRCSIMCLNTNAGMRIGYPPLHHLLSEAESFQRDCASGGFRVSFNNFVFNSILNKGETWTVIVSTELDNGK